MRQPYIGITGFKTREQVEAVLAAHPAESEFLVMVGVLANDRSIRDEPVKNSKRYPAKDELGKIFVKHPKALNLIHFNTGRPSKLLDDMFYALLLAGPDCQGLQLNIPWPSKQVLRDFQKYCQSEYCKTIVLQCGKKALNEVGWSPRKLTERLKAYKGLIDYVLIDPSSGTGQEFDPYFVCACFGAIGRALPDIGLGIAGGLNAESLGRLLDPILGAFPGLGFSTDTETGVRDDQDDFVVPEAIRYLRQANEILNRKKTMV